MRKASKILLLIGGIVGIIVAVWTLVSALFAFGIMQLGGLAYSGVGIVSLLIDNDVIPAEFTLLGAVENDIIFIVEGVFMLVCSFIVLIACFITFVFQLVSSIIALKSRGKNPKKGLYIANFIFAGLLIFIFGTDTLGFIAEVLVIVGSILGLIVLKKEKAIEEQPAEEAPVVEEIK